jgi:hypothetical protein
LAVVACAPVVPPPVPAQTYAEVRPSLGRDLGACGGRTPCAASTAAFDLFPHVASASNVLNMTTRCGPAWLNAIQIMGERLMKVSLRLDF